MKRWREEGKITPAPCLRSRRSPSSLVSFVLCISMIKRWWNRAAGRSLDTETMLSLEQASTAAEQPPRDRATTTHTLLHPPPPPPLIHVDKHVNTRRTLDYCAQEDSDGERCCAIKERLQESPKQQKQRQEPAWLQLCCRITSGPDPANTQPQHHLLST